jgi:RNA-directed DNA polymerase
MRPEWFKTRGYKHLDAPVGDAFAERVCDSQFVKIHSWLPLIRYIKRVKRYKPTQGQTEYKERPIMYASHRDACILAKFSHELNILLDKFYIANNLSEHVIAYRKLGRANYHFSSHAYSFALATAPCVILCFDITGFFDNLDHSILKDRLKRILALKELPDHWYKVFRHVTAFRSIERSDLEEHPVFGSRFDLKSDAPIATIAEVKQAGIAISVNPDDCGIPQGTPISSSLSNLYMMDIDSGMSSICNERKALYQRYSDDIIVICRLEDEADICDVLQSSVEKHKLKIKDEKTERLVFQAGDTGSIQYLGFNMSQSGVAIRSASLARQWRKLKRSVRRTKRKGMAEMRAGRSSMIYTKKLRKLLSPIGVRNFSQYARRSSKAFGSKDIVKQVRGLERAADKAIRELKELV